MKTLNHFIIFLCSILLITSFTSCEDVVSIELDDEDIDLIVVESYISTEAKNNVYVKLTRTLPVNDTTANPAINNAVITLTDNAETPNSVTLKENDTSGIYTLPKDIIYPGIAGRTYTLSISTTDGTVVTAQDYLSEVATLDSFKINLCERGDYNYLGVYISTQESPGAGDYYKWNIYVNGSFLSKSGDLLYANDELIDGNYLSDCLIMIDWEDEEEDKVFNKGDEVIVKQLSMTESAYDFYSGLINQATSGSLFSVPPANVPSNLTSNNGKTVRGIFSARDVSTSKPVIIDDSNYTPLN